MIFEYVKLCNFGAYKGEHRVELGVTPERPIVLIGALNGSGKTTFLDAMQLALYGKGAHCSGRERVSYPEYLESMINRDAPPEEGAEIEFAFLARASGQDMHIRVVRAWKKRGENVKEIFEVFRNGELDSVASERWIEFVEDFMPAQIAELFFFDGEKIEALADPQRSAALLRVGIHSLLGIDLVESLQRSLQQIERKRKTNTASESDKVELQIIEAELNEAHQFLERGLMRRASAQNDLDSLEKEQAILFSEFNRIGGGLLVNRERLLLDELQLRAKKKSLEDELRMLAASALPLMIPSRVLEIAVQKAKTAKKAGNAEILRSEAEVRDATIEKFVKSLGIERESLVKLRRHLEEDRVQRYPVITEVSLISGESLDQFSTEATEAMSRLAMNALASLADVDEELHSTERNLAAVPEEEDVAKVQKKMAECAANLARSEAVIKLLDDEILTLRYKLDRLKGQADREAERLGERLTRDEVAQRVINHSSRAREVLASFGDRLLSNNLSRLETSILTCFRRLIRKTTLVDRISIQPESFRISVTNAAGQQIAASRLSAGERQLLAVATLWALAHASGRALPAVIDTPLSRLDSKHRGSLVENYFPIASHQVILLSTDEEVVGLYQEQLAPFVSRHYLIEHDEAKNTSCFTTGYFPNNAVELKV
ncbi:DNA sulfur modification protein DndD [Undibacterium sp. GrIS 1.2]|uniref:DNA sulfur modification protein DndD n=1 Tax=Undibacterium sp. GrIS 1.2 TaxID=3143933 RepID=UPI0033922FBF